MEQCCEIVGVIVDYLQALSLDTRTAHGTPFFKVRFDCAAPVVLLCSILPDSAYNRVDDALAWNISCSLIDPTTFENADIDPRISPYRMARTLSFDSSSAHIRVI